MAVYEEFCRKETAVLFATDIAARGLDFPAIDWVIQMDCPDDANSYIHRAGRTARYQKGGEALLMLLPSEEAMIEHLAQKKIPIQKIEVNPSKLFSIQRKLEAFLAMDPEFKQMAQRAFVTYIKSVFLMKDKTVFDVHQIDLNALARSLGLAIAPRVRFLQKRIKEASTSKKATASTPDSTSVSTSTSVAAKPIEKDWRRRDLEATFQFHTEEEEHGSDSEEDVLKMKRKDHALPFDDTAEDNIEQDKNKKIKILTKEKVAKRILAKKLTANQKIAFDEDGNVSSIYILQSPFLNLPIFFYLQRVYDAKREKVSEVARAMEIEATISSYGGIDLEEAKKAMQEEDKFDKEIFRQRIKARHREERLKAKAERRQQSNHQEDDIPEEDIGDSESEESLDGSVTDIIDALPDPDRIYGNRDSDDDDDDDESFQRGPAPPKYIKSNDFSVHFYF